MTHIRLKILETYAKNLVFVTVTRKLYYALTQKERHAADKQVLWRESLFLSVYFAFVCLVDDSRTQTDNH